MRVHFHGAAGEVTGSMHLVEAAGKRILLDCGLCQGSAELEASNADPFPFDVAGIDALVLSHAHIDHIGRVPLLVKRGFRGAIHAQTATAELLPIMLLDAASLAESDAERFNRRRAHGEAQKQPLYTKEDVADAIDLLRAHDYDRRASVLDGIEIAFRDAGHILGSSIVELWADGRKLVFSGDLGPHGTPILRDPTPIREADLLLMESTYGDRNHKQRADTIIELGDILEQAWRDGGNVLIPAFAVGRSQELLYWFARHWDEWKLSRWQVFLDSPMAGKVVQVYDRHHDLFDAEARKVWAERPSPFRLPNLHVTASTEESMAINRFQRGAIIIAGSGMCTGGRIVHHFKHNIWRQECHVVFPGFQARGTLGRSIVDGAEFIKVLHQRFAVRAKVHTLGGFSAHAGRAQLIDWVSHFDHHPELYLVHGELEKMQALQKTLKEQLNWDASIPEPGEQIAI